VRRALKALLLVFILCAAAAAQTEEALRPRLIDSFGEIQWSDLIARLDSFAIELQNEPAAAGYVVAYAAPHKFPGWPLRRVGAARDYLTKMRGLDVSRVFLFNGGLRAETAFELWVVPAGAERPFKPFDVSLLMSGERAAVPFDRFVVIERGDQPVAEYYHATPYAHDADLYAYFAEVLRRDPTLRGCVIGYTSRRGARAADRRIASRAKLQMLMAHGVDVGRVVALGGGRREYKMVELWLVPPGAELPKPTPDALPARRKRR
jgi:hypothetical protein